MSNVFTSVLDRPASQRVSDYLNQTSNPYEQGRASIKVRVSYAGECDITEAVSRYIASRDNVKEAIQTK